MSARFDRRDRSRRVAVLTALAAAAWAAGCAPRGTCRGDWCGTVVFAGFSRPVTLLPPVTVQALDRDIFGQIFLKLADVGSNLNTVGDAGFAPQLADRWSWTDSLTLAFHLDPRARWQDGVPVTARDVAFTFAAYTDSALDSPFRAGLSRIAAVTAADSATAVFRFRARYPEMFYDAVYNLRVLPAHLLDTVPPSRWRSAAFGRAPVGDGPYRFARWSGESLELDADPGFFLGRPHIRRLIWRFNGDFTVAVTQLIAGEADAIEVLVTPPNIARARAVAHLALYPYPGSVYTVVGFNLRAQRGGGPHPVLGDAAVRRALVLATDRVAMARSVFGDAAKVPPGPIPESWATLWFADLPVPPYDTAAAARLLDSAGWKMGRDHVRHRGGSALAFALAVPSTSPARQKYAQIIQEELRHAGVDVRIEALDPPTLDQRLRTGRYDAALESWSSDPTPSSGLPDAWKSGGGSNFGHYADPAFDRAVDAALHARTAADAARAWRDALGILAQDAPAIVLCANDNVAAVDRRIAGVRLRADEPWAYVREWRIPADRLIARDRLAGDSLTAR